MIDIESDQTLDGAMGKLVEAESQETAIPTEAFVQADESAITADGSQESKIQTPDKSPSDTPAATKPADATDTKTDKTEQKADKTPDAKPDNRSKFSKDKQRKDDSWNALNTEKAAFHKEQESLSLQRKQLEQQQNEFQARQAKSNNRFTPEQYEQAARNKLTEADALNLEADGLDRRAEKFDEAGEVGKAELARQQAVAKRKQANGAEAISEQYKGLADHTRKNPDPTLEQIKAKNQSAIQQYTLKAAEQWPELSRQGSEFQKSMVKVLEEGKVNGLDENEIPVIRYHAARLVAAELAAARVPDLEKKLGAAEAKVKELEALTAPGGGSGSVQSQSVKTPTDDDEADILRNHAKSIS